MNTGFSIIQPSKINNCVVYPDTLSLIIIPINHSIQSAIILIPPGLQFNLTWKFLPFHYLSQQCWCDACYHNPLLLWRYTLRITLGITQQEFIWDHIKVYRNYTGNYMVMGNYAPYQDNPSQMCLLQTQKGQFLIPSNLGNINTISRQLNPAQVNMHANSPCLFQAALPTW